MLLRENKQGRSGLSRWIAQRKDVISAIRKHAGHSGTLGKGGVGGEVVDEGRETGNTIYIYFFLLLLCNNNQLFISVFHSHVLLSAKLGIETASF